MNKNSHDSSGERTIRNYVDPIRFHGEMEQGINILEYQVSPKTRYVAHQIMKDSDFLGSIDYQTLGLMYNMIIFTNSTKVLEIGSWIGFSGIFLLDAINSSHGKTEKMFVTIDPNTEKQSKAKNNYEQAGFNGLYDLVPFGSETKEAISQVMKHAPYDVLFIDSKHDYSQAKKELETYFKFVRKGGFIFCHDTSELATTYDTKKEGGVRRALKEFVSKNPIEFVFLEQDVIDKMPIGWNPVGAFMGIKKE